MTNTLAKKDEELNLANLIAEKKKEALVRVEKHSSRLQRDLQRERDERENEQRMKDDEIEALKAKLLKFEDYEEELDSMMAKMSAKLGNPFIIQITIFT